MMTRSSFMPTSRFAHFLGLDSAAIPQRTTTRTTGRSGVDPAPAARVASAPSSSTRSAARQTTTPVPPAYPAETPAARGGPRKPRAQVGTPFMDRMGDVLQAQAAEQRLSDGTMSIPEMRGGIATGNIVKVVVPAAAATAPRDPAAVAAKVIAAGERARGIRNGW